MLRLSYSSEPVMRLDCQILLKSPPLNLLVGSVPVPAPQQVQPARKAVRVPATRVG